MKKSYLLLLVGSQLLYSCAQESETSSLVYKGKTSERSFTHLDQEQPKLTSEKRVNPSERSYPGSGSSRKYVLRDPSYMPAKKDDTEISAIQNSFEENSAEDGPVVSGPLENEESNDLARADMSSKTISDSDMTTGMSNPETEKYGGYYKIGNPYKIDGVTYYPEKYDNFEEVGLASWYGSDFHGKSTANGEIYNMQDFTAAHRTLPLPSMVKVTNLSNGRTAIVRVNDRGPFASNRVIDVSERAAEQLGFKDKGTTTVKVQFLKNETRALLVKINREKNEQLQKQGN